MSGFATPLARRTVVLTLPPALALSMRVSRTSFGRSISSCHGRGGAIVRNRIPAKSVCEGDPGRRRAALQSAALGLAASWLHCTAGTATRHICDRIPPCPRSVPHARMRRGAHLRNLRLGQRTIPDGEPSQQPHKLIAQNRRALAATWVNKVCLESQAIGG